MAHLVHWAIAILRLPLSQFVLDMQPSHREFWGGSGVPNERHPPNVRRLGGY